MSRNYTDAELKSRMAEIIELGVALRGPSVAERMMGGDADAITPRTANHVAHDWRFWGRPKQLVALEPELPDWFPFPRSDRRWRIMLYMAGRGLGKNRTGSETTWYRIERGLAKSVGFIGPNWRDLRRHMVGGLPDTDSGILDVIPPWLSRGAKGDVFYDKNKQEIYVRPYGATIYLMTAEDPEQRGGNFDWVWGDEPIKWRRLNAVLYNLRMAMRRITSAPQMLFTTTPKPQQWLKDMIMDPRTVVVHGVTAENESNLHPDFLADVYERYKGTRIGSQELGANLLGDLEGAIAQTSQIEAGRLEEAPELEETGVAVDPAVSTRRKSDDSGIVGCGRRRVRGVDNLFVLEDRSAKLKPNKWADEAVDIAKDWGATWIVVERNKIGDLGWTTLAAAIKRAGMDGKIEIREAYSQPGRDKWTRASESLSPLYDQGRAHHVGRFTELETQLTQWDPREDKDKAKQRSADPTEEELAKSVSPNNLDALALCAIELLGLAKEKKKNPSKGLAEANETGWDNDDGGRTI